MLDIKKEREALQLTQEAFAALLGVSRKTIVNYEAGGNIPETKAKVFKRILSNTALEANQMLKTPIKAPCIKKEGVVFTLTDAALLIARHPEASKQDPLIKQFVASIFLEVLKKSKDEDNSINLEKFLDNI